MWGKDGQKEGVCKIPMRLPMKNGAMETVECMWVDIWCMLDWIIGLCQQDCRNAFPRHGSLNQRAYKMRRRYGWRRLSMRKLEPIARLNIRRPNKMKGGLLYPKQNWKSLVTGLWNNENIGSYVGYYKKSNLGYHGGSLGSQPPCYP